jgi:predicted PurR-regulated permease PerM
VKEGVTIEPGRACPGDVILLSGPIASHGMAVMSVREGLEFETPIESDTVALNGLVDRMLDVCADIHVLRDPTRGGVASALLAILLLVFVLANPRPLVTAYLALTPDRYRQQAHRTLERMMRQMIAWARGVVINGVITGVSIGSLLWLVGVQPALIFGVIAFLGEFLPNIGAFLVSIPILLVALSMGATKFWLALGVIVVVYQVELNVLVPGVLGKEMRLHPVNILFFTLATAELFGFLGLFLAVPAAALVQIVIDEFYLQPRKIDAAALDREAAVLVEGRK